MDVTLLAVCSRIFCQKPVSISLNTKWTIMKLNLFQNENKISYAIHQSNLGKINSFGAIVDFGRHNLIKPASQKLSA